MMINTREIVHYAAPKYIRGKTLDIGGGTAKYRGIIEPHTSEYLVSDLYPNAEVDLVLDARQMDLPSESFDTVLAFQLLEHVDDTQAVANEMHRVLRPGGRAVVTVPFMYAQHGSPQDFHRFTPEGIKFYFQRAGFTCVESGTQGSTLSVLADAIKCLWVPQDGLAEAKYGRIRKGLATRVMNLLKALDRRGWAHNKNFYSNLYLVVEK